MIRNQLPLIESLINAFLFLECSGPDEVDPDSAVRCMENMSASLLSLDEADQILLRSQLQEIADKSQDPTYANFVRQMPDSIGLAGGCSN
jgi:hypothetical protein